MSKQQQISLPDSKTRIHIIKEWMNYYRMKDDCSQAKNAYYHIVDQEQCLKSSFNSTDPQIRRTYFENLSTHQMDNYTSSERFLIIFLEWKVSLSALTLLYKYIPMLLYINLYFHTIYSAYYMYYPLHSWLLWLLLLTVVLSAHLSEIIVW